ncbi:MAG TPA: nuclear transport factor 2 family protein [Myxococcaceae bacterium]|nr:nuclear transport factor 2 family protein [Myxococcaceae bacterium]
MTIATMRFSATSTEAVLQRHLRAATVGVDAIMEDYTEQSVLITHDATYRGHTEIRRFFTGLFEILPEGFFAEMRLTRQEIAGEVGYILWERAPVISQATDTFVVRDGKILFQTFTPPKGALAGE